MNKNLKRIPAILLILTLALSLTACGTKEEEAKRMQIAIPNDTTNEARALLLLEAAGLIEVDDAAGITATLSAITSNPKNIDFKEVEAAQIPNVLQDVDYAVINGNYAIPAGLSPAADSLVLEGEASPYTNVISVKDGRQKEPLMLALAAAVQSKQVADYIKATYPDGSVVSTVSNPTDGFDSSVDYAALAGKTIKIAATPSPHAEILSLVKEILAEKDITLDIVEFTDYVQPNNVVESGEFDANFFQHVPYMDDFNAQNGTHIVSLCHVHCEPMGLYPGKQTSLDALK